MRHKIFHPATAISLLALLVALGGTSYAVSQLPKNSVGPNQIKKNAVRSVKVKNGSLRRQDFAPGQILEGPRAYAFVAADGTLDQDRSFSVDVDNVFKGTGAADSGFYCFADLPFRPRNAIATPIYEKSTPFFLPAASLSLEIAKEEQGILNPTGCPSSNLQVVINTRNSLGDSEDSAFVIWFED